MTVASASVTHRLAGDPSLVERSVASPRRCRCGQRFTPGSPAFELAGLANSIAPMFEARSYCSGKCARADLLEMFETLDAIVGSPAGAMVVDLRQTYFDLGQAFAAILS